jgi:hypothetical protein
MGLDAEYGCVVMRALGAALAVVTLAGTALAFAPNKRQDIVIENIAQAIAGTNKCDDWAVNEKMVTLTAIGANVMLGNQAVFDYVETRVQFHAERFKPRTREDICGALERFFGPEGSAAPNLVKRAT